MAVDNTTIGSVLTIPEGLISNLEKVDDRIKKIQESARATGTTFNTQFAGMTSNTNFLINNLDKIISQLGTIGSAARTASQATQGMGQGMSSATQGMSGFGTSITGVIQMINQMVGQLQASGQIGTSQIMAVKLAWDKLQEAMQYKNTGSIAIITEEIKGIDKQLKDTENLLTKTEQDALVERKRLLQEELKEAQRTQGEREVNLQKTLDRMFAAEQKYQKHLQQNYKKTAEQYKAQNYANNTTYEGSIKFAESANTINRRLKAIEYLREARAKLTTQDAEYAKKLEEINAAIKRLDKTNRDAVQSSKNLGTAYESLTKTHHNLLDTAGQLQRAFALMFSVSQIRGYIGQIAKVRGEFELQQRSLEAILQNKTKADEIFNKTVALAVQSPYQIKDLVSYTKQLAAYRIESDKLYDTTKRLADVSAGLGVDMQRLILAYGQVKAAAYLRGTEVRQFTEAGINLYGELQSYFKEVKGEAYTTAQIVDMISKRMVTFEDVEAIFRRITDQGGIFYNMQAIQAETLQGKIANLRDSVDIMLNDIGKANEGAFKGTIDFANTLIRNWQTLADVGKALIIVFGALKLNSMMVGKSMSVQFLELAQFEKISKATNGLKMLGVAWKNAGIAAKAAGIMMKEALMANAWLLAIGAVVDVLYQVYERNEQYKQSLSKTNSEYAAAATQVRKLADEYRALSASSKEANDGEIANADQKRAALEKLVDTMQKSNMTIGFNVDIVSDADLDKYFESSLKRYETFLKNKQLLEYRYNKDIKNTWFADDIQEDAKDYENAYNEVLIKSKQVEDVINQVGLNYDNLSKKAKAAYDELQKPKPTWMDDVEYINQQVKLLSQIQRSLFSGAAQESPLFNYMGKSLVDVRSALIDVQKAKDELLRIENIGGKQMWVGELAGDVKILQEQYKKAVQDGINEGLTKAQAQKRAAFDIQAQIDVMGAYRNWQDLHKKLIYEAGPWKQTIVFDEQKAKGQIDSIKKQMDDAFANNTYTVTIKWDKQVLSEDQALDEFEKNAQQKLDQLQKLVKRRNNLKNGTIKLDGYDPIANNIQINDTYNDICKLGDGYKALADQIMGYNKKTTNSTNANKIQRDILSEQISLLKEMQSRYDSLREVMGDDKAQSSVLSYYKESLKYVKMPSSVVNTFVPTKQGVIDALNKLIPTIKDFKKQMEAKNLAAQFKVEIRKEELQKEIDAAKQQIEDAFSGLNVYTDLKKMGLGESDIAVMFGDLPKTFDDVQKKIAEVYNGKEGEDWAKQRQETEKKLQEQVVKYNLDTFKELTKAYKTQLSDQLQLDAWYVEEKRKIEQNEELKKYPELKRQYQENLDNTYKQRSDNNSWKDFQNSELYINMFGEMERMSNRTINIMIDRLNTLRDTLKNLSPENVKTIQEQLNKLMSIKAERNPFSALARSIKESHTYAKELRLLTKDTSLESLYSKQDSLTEETKILNEQVTLEKELYNEAVKVNGATSQQAIFAKYTFQQTQDVLKSKAKELKLTKEQIDAINKLLGLQAEANSTTSDSIVKIVDDVSSITNSIVGLFDAIGQGNEDLKNALTIFGDIGGIVANIASKNWAGVVSGAIGMIGNIIRAFNGDDELEAKIERQQRQIARLQWEYNNLKTAMDEAWDTSSLIEYKDKAIEALEATNRSLKAMISAEKSKKDTDWGQIEEWQRQIEDNNKAIKEQQENLIEQLGGFGKESAYKNAAQAFADSWVDAFNEGSDALDALNDKMDEYIDNLIKRQVMMRGAKKYLQPLFDTVDKALEEGSEGGVDLTGDELKKIQETKDKSLDEFNQYAELMMKVLGVSPKGASTLSKLQQGIQSITESTGQALEGILNSVRFFVQQQSSDISVIRLVINNIYSAIISQTGTNVVKVQGEEQNYTPIIAAIEEQTNIVKRIDESLRSVIKLGHPQGGYGMRVFIDGIK